MIYKNKKETSAITFLGHVIGEVYRGLVLVWQSIRSCYGKGIWFEEKPWLDNDLWKDSK